MSKRSLAVVALMIAAVSGCQDGGKPPGIATAGGTPTASAAATDVVTQYVEAMRAYVTCLRAEGVKVSDPDPKGQIEFQGDLRTLKADPKFINGQKKCAGLHPPVPQELIELPKRTPEEIDAAGRYAKCMRANGAPDFPDPGPDGYFPDGRDGGPGWNQDTPAAIKAGQTCAPIVGGPASPGPAQG
jgi:hypothetical protein